MLRAAVMESNASIWRDTIEVPSGLYQLTLPVNSGGGDYNPFGLSTGYHTLTATPFAAMAGGGAAGGSRTITFTVR
jgi:hypothetical protein